MGIMQDKRRVIEIPLDDIYPNPAQPRRSFPEKELLELSRSIRQNGLLQPLSVRRTRNGYGLQESGVGAPADWQGWTVQPVL